MNALIFVGIWSIAVTLFLKGIFSRWPAEKEAALVAAQNEANNCVESIPQYLRKIERLEDTVKEVEQRIVQKNRHSKGLGDKIIALVKQL
jgi:hypothetical protein